MSIVHQPGQPVWAPLDHRAHAALLHDLSAIDEFWRRFDVALLTPPAAGSAAAADLADKLRAYAHDQAATAIRAALDHLRSWRTLLNAGEVPTYAHLSLIRTAHEAAFVALWLADPAIDSDTRRARGIAAQADDYDERRKAEEAIGLMVAQPPGRLAADRLADLMSAADSLGLVSQNRRGQPILAVTLPPAVELFDLYEPVSRPTAKGQFFYRLYSAYAHAKQWAMSMGAQPKVPYDASGRTIALNEGNDLLTVAATQRVVRAVDRALTAYEQLRKP